MSTKLGADPWSLLAPTERVERSFASGLHTKVPPRGFRVVVVVLIPVLARLHRPHPLIANVLASGVTCSKMVGAAKLDEFV